MRHVKSYRLRPAGNAAVSDQVGVAESAFNRGQNQVTGFHIKDATKLRAQVKWMAAFFYFKIRRVRHACDVQLFQIAGKLTARENNSTQRLENTEVGPGQNVFTGDCRAPYCPFFVLPRANGAAGLYLARRNRKMKFLARPKEAIFRATQAYARIQGRDYATPDDAQAVAEPVLAHRILSLASDGFGAGGREREIVRKILATVPVPV